MSEVTMNGVKFSIEEDPSLQAGMTMTEEHVKALQNYRRDQIRARFNLRMKRAMDEKGTFSEEDRQRLQEEMSAHAAEFEFGERLPRSGRKGGGRPAVDPVSRKMAELGRKVVVDAYRRIHGSKPDRATVKEELKVLLENNYDYYRQRAEQEIRESEDAARLMEGRMSGNATAEAAE